jgi:triacylglycerol lipase
VRAPYLSAILTVLSLTTACAGCGDDGNEISGVSPGTVPVVLAHGYGGSPEAMEAVGRRLGRHGRKVLYVELPDAGRARIEDSGRAVREVVDASRARRVDFVGFSLGGLAVRDFLRFEGGAAHARRVVFLGTPNHGTRLAGPGPGCDRGCAQMAPGSGFLRALNAGDETPGRARYVSIYSRFDETVTPPRTSRLAGATNIALGAPALSHVDLVTDPRPVRLAVDAVEGRRAGA